MRVSRFYTHGTLVCTAEYPGAGISLSIFAPVSGNFSGFHTHTEGISLPCPRRGGEVSTVYLSTNFAHISTSLYLSIIDVQIVQQCCLLCFSRSTDKHIKAVNQIFKILLTNSTMIHLSLLSLRPNFCAPHYAFEPNGSAASADGGKSGNGSSIYHTAKFWSPHCT